MRPRRDKPSFKQITGELKNPFPRAKKYLGQNFLVDPNIKKKIIEHCDLSDHDIVWEIGPGRGALTSELTQRAKEVYVIEKDQPLAKRLEEIQTPNLKVITADFLDLDLNQLPVPTKVIGNLPYNISTPIIEKLLGHRQRLTDIFITVQLEFGQRLAAKPHTKEYGSLSCFVQYYADVDFLFRIKNTAFRPIPKVHSGFVHLKIRPPRRPAADEKFLFELIRAAFQQRRKQLSNALYPLIGEEGIRSLQEQGETLSLRAENLGVDDYVRLAELLGRKEKGRPKPSR